MSDIDNYSSYSEDDDYNEISDELEELDEVTKSMINNSGESEESDEASEDLDADVITLKNTMIFPKKSKITNEIKTITSNFKRPTEGSKPLLPQLKGIILPSSKRPVEGLQKIEAPKIKKHNTEEIEMLIKNMPGINILDNSINYDRLDIHDLFLKEAQESIKDFEIRKEITLKISDLENPKIRNYTCVVIGSMIAKKLRFGNKYEKDIEDLIKEILSKLA